jgi:hypothetical protein
MYDLDVCVVGELSLFYINVIYISYMYVCLDVHLGVSIIIITQ